MCPTLDALAISPRQWTEHKHAVFENSLAHIDSSVVAVSYLSNSSVLLVSGPGGYVGGRLRFFYMQQDVYTLRKAHEEALHMATNYQDDLREADERVSAGKRAFMRWRRSGPTCKQRKTRPRLTWQRLRRPRVNLSRYFWRPSRSGTP